MELKTSALAADIKQVYIDNSSYAMLMASSDNDDKDAAAKIDEFAKKISDGIAKSVVSNIKNGLVIVESLGTGNQSAPVNSKSLKAVGLNIVDDL